jgi:hypothetical protein
MKNKIKKKTLKKIELTQPKKWDRNNLIKRKAEKK